MKRNFGFCFLIFCFSLSNTSFALATQVVDVPPIIVQSEEIRELNQQMIDQAQMDRDQELAIKGLIADSQRLVERALAIQQDTTLDKVHQTLVNYRDFLLSRDVARIEANSHKVSKYHDLVKLTEDVDDLKDAQGMNGVSHTIQLKSNVIEQKYKVLTELKDELTSLNEKLKGQAVHKDVNQINDHQADKIQMLTQRLAEMDHKIAGYDDIIAGKDRQIAQLKDDLAKIQDASAKNKQSDQLVAQLSQKQQQVDLLKSELENKITEMQKQGGVSENKQVDELRRQLSQKQEQVDLLKSELGDKITEANNQDKVVSAKDRIITQQEDQIAVLKTRSQELSSREEDIKSQAEQMARSLKQFKNQGAVYAQMQAELSNLKNKMDQQALKLKSKNETLKWLNQVLAASKNKTEYFKLTAQQEHLSMRQVQDQVQQIKDDFAKKLEDSDQFDNSIASLKEKVSLLKSELESKVAETNSQTQKESQINQDLKGQLQDKENQIVKMKADILEILQAQANKEIYHRAQLDDRVKLAKQLVDLQQQETVLLDEKNELTLQQYDIFDRHFAAFEDRMKTLLASHRIQDIDLRDRMETLKDELGQEHQEVDSLKTQLEGKISAQKNQDQLQMQIQDLRSQLQDKEDQITAITAKIQSGQETQGQEDTLRQHLADQQNQLDLLKQELESKNTQSNQMALMMADYQKKLESKDNAYNQEFQQVLLSKNNQTQSEGQIADLNTRLQEKEAQFVKIKKDMYDLQESIIDKDRDLQAKDLSLSMVQQKMMNLKINGYQDKINGLQAIDDKQAKEVISLKTDLALARQELKGMPSSDEINFLRTGLKDASLQLKQKDAMLLRIKTNADEYEREFKEQAKEFQSVKQQLQDAYEDINKRNEDLKYKNLEIIRLKERTTVKEGDLQGQVRALTLKLEAADKRLMSKTHGNKIQALEAQLISANKQIKDLREQLDRFTLSPKGDPVRAKLKQALDKINEQGRFINVLAQKLQDCGKSVDLTQYTVKQ